MPVDFTAPPTLATFMKSKAFGRIAAGPVGSGKTTACLIEILRRSMAQAKAPDGYRYTRWAVVRQTLKQLKDTVLKDAQSWFEGLGEWRVSENTYYLRFADVKSELVFIPLENAEDQARLLSMQLTGAWLSEAIEMNFDVLAPVSGRIGRYPSGNRGVPSLVRDHRRHKYASRTERLAQVHDRAPTELAGVHPAQRHAPPTPRT